MDIKDKLEEIHKDVRELRKENTEAHGAIATILMSIRENTWHQFKLIHDKLLDLFSWEKK